MKAITDRQMEVLVFWRRYMATYHCSPTRRDLCEFMGILSPQGSDRHLDALERKGFLVPIIAGNGNHRGYRLTEVGLAVTEAADLAPLPPPSAVNPRQRKRTTSET